MSPLEAALQGAREIGFTVLSISVSLVAVFIPILLMGGMVGRLFREFAVTLSVAVARLAGRLADHHPDDVRAPARAGRGHAAAAGSPRSSERVFDWRAAPATTQRSAGCCATRVTAADRARRRSRSTCTSS